MTDFLSLFIQCSISMSLVTLAYMAMLPYLAKRYAAKWLYLIWWVVSIGWLIPLRPHIAIPFVPVHNGSTTAPFLSEHGDIRATTGMVTRIVGENDYTAATSFLEWRIFAGIWLIGVLLVLSFQLYRHFRFLKLTNRWSEPVAENKILEIFETLTSELNIKTKVRVKFCRVISSPMLTGLIRPVILLPRDIMEEEEYRYIMKHELIHFKRFDLWLRLMMLGVKSLHWFNPLVYLMDRTISLYGEISCDERVLQGEGFHKRKKYGELLIKVIRNGSITGTSISTNLFGGKRNMRKRIDSIMAIRQKKNGVVILALILTGLFLISAVWNSPEAKAGNRQIPSAKAEALEVVVENCNVRVQLASDQKLSFVSDAEFIEVVQNTKKTTTQITIRPKRGQSATDAADMVTLLVPEQKYKTVTVKGDKAGISLPALNADLDLTIIDGSLSAVLPKGFANTLKMAVENGAGSLHIDQGASNYKLSMGIKESALTIPEQFPGYKHGASSFTYKSGKGKAQVQVDLSGSAFSISDN
ncbi:M56 family metallopeptidase [Paenibacillus sp. alder61]|uniref:M56 family metallopeptidase n=1 Tax=Paenibacillus faecis TaxID=862114 RepID=A0A5D0D1B5_9BACL|nr:MULTISPECIES: M56 family metallopeptidase [Paenibacillus]MCA1291699.1 M56 family metallopeptidase [Paenibacillus sp. alder61]TYA14937.1 M56 family metallopeptidase [Paenibacillus faecis]